MNERISNILKIIFGLFLAVCCISLKALGLTEPGTSFPYIGAALGLFIAFGHFKRLFDK